MAVPTLVGKMRLSKRLLSLITKDTLARGPAVLITFVTKVWNCTAKSKLFIKVRETIKFDNFRYIQKLHVLTNYLTFYLTN
jgi:hypothetical protein